MNEQIILRQETTEDFPEVFKINHLAFGQDDEAKLVDALRKNESAFCIELKLLM